MVETIGRSALVDGVGPSDTGWHPLVLRVTGAGLLFACGAIHLDLYLTGYRSIPTIGGLFLLQIIVAFGPRGGGPRLPSPVASAAGALFALPPWAATSCRCGSACSGSGRSARRRGSWPD